MPLSRFTYLCVLVAPFALAQTGTRLTLGPPEFSGSAPSLPAITPADREMGELLSKSGGDDKLLATVPLLDEFIRRHPEYADAYSLRAYITMCLASPGMLQVILIR